MIAGIKLPNYKDLIPNIFEINAIRINKLLHMAQRRCDNSDILFFCRNRYR